MAISPKDSGQMDTNPNYGTRHKIPWVEWIAIPLGVTMTLVGIMLLLWGLAWQATVGEPVELQGGELTGGACLVPFGAMSATIGILWLLTGWKGFKKARAEEGTAPCPFCGKMIETDLTFCYYCNRSFDNEQQEGLEARKKKTGNEEVGPSRKARPFEPLEKE